jgi:oligoendopeptidase F
MATAIAEVVTRDQIPVGETWDLTDYYPSDASWTDAADGVTALVEKAASYRGRLTESAGTLREGLDAVMEAQRVISRLFTYASLRSDEDITNRSGRGAGVRGARDPGGR